MIDLESYGYDIETSWLIDRACEVLGKDECTVAMASVSQALVQSTYKNGYDREIHILYNEREGKQIDRQKIWWVQAEAVVGFYHAYQKEPERMEYSQAAEEII